MPISTTIRARIGLNLPTLLANHPFALGGMEIDDISYKYIPATLNNTDPNSNKCIGVI